MKPYRGSSGGPEAGVDEAGRGCLAGPVYAAAVILPAGFHEPLLDDSKQLGPALRERLRRVIEARAVAWAVASCDPAEIDALNILNATFLAMHRALDGLAVAPRRILVDGNRFKPYRGIPHACIVGGDAALAPVAAASVLAKTHRDECMLRLHAEFPQYGWNRNKAYATRAHREAVLRFGRSPHHRRSFTVQIQEKLFS
jgi:ribonuclease HII